MRCDSSGDRIRTQARCARHPPRRRGRRAGPRSGRRPERRTRTRRLRAAPTRGAAAGRPTRARRWGYRRGSPGSGRRPWVRPCRWTRARLGSGAVERSRRRRRPRREGRRAGGRSVRVVGRLREKGRPVGGGTFDGDVFRLRRSCSAPPSSALY
jgi:hypothetical protein